MRAYCEVLPNVMTLVAIHEGLHFLPSLLKKLRKCIQVIYACEY